MPHSGLIPMGNRLGIHRYTRIHARFQRDARERPASSPRTVAAWHARGMGTFLKPQVRRHSRPASRALPLLARNTRDSHRTPARPGVDPLPAGAGKEDQGYVPLSQTRLARLRRSAQQST
jgi:hypothetical protein